MGSVKEFKSQDLVSRRFFLIPNLITVVGLFCGFLAVIYAVQGRFLESCYSIGVAFLLDGLDGRVARKLNATSEFGRELDSLSDSMAFGLAPSFIVYNWAFVELVNDFAVLVCFLYLACGAIRLARFNITPDSPKKSSFIGLPIPAAALSVVSLIIYFKSPPDTYIFTLALLVYLFVLSSLMVSSFSYPSVKHIKVSQIPQKHLLAFTALVVALSWYKGKIVLLLLSNLYALSGPIYSLFFKKR